MKRFLYVLSGVVLSVAVGTAAWMGRSHYELWAAEHALNEFYRQHRPFSYRWQGASYQVQGQSSLSEDARQQLDGISLRLELWRDGLASDVGWLRLRGRVALLEGNYDRAAAQYRRARLLSHNDPNVTAELAVAYALRADAEKRAIDYGAALNYAAEAASGKTPPPFALFNLAVLAEKIPLPRVALEQWQAAGATEKDSAWRPEIAAHRQQLVWMLRERQRNRDALRDPASIGAPVTSLPGALEDMQQEALQGWVLMNPPPREALEFLSSEFRKRKDNWWRDFMSVPLDRGANTLLSQTLVANAVGNYADAEKAGAQAEAAFQRTGNAAGRLRARRERLEASHRGDSTQKCLPLLRGVVQQAEDRAYPWLTAQLRLDGITCRNLELQGASLEERLRVHSQIQMTGFEGVTLRALAFLSEPEVSAGTPLRAWSGAQQGLAKFWTTVITGYRAYHFSWNLSEASRLAGYANAALMLRREAVLNLGEYPNRGLRGSALSELATLEGSLGHYENAATDFAEAEALLAGTRSHRYTYDIEIRRAQVELEAGRFAEALQRLSSADKLRDPSFKPDDLAYADNLNSKGTAFLRLGRYQEAATAFTELVRLHADVLSQASSGLERESVAHKYDFAFRGLTEAQLHLGGPSTPLSSWLAFRAGLRIVPPHIKPPLNSALLVFADLPGGISAWLVDRRGIEHHWISSAGIGELELRLMGLAADRDAPIGAIRDAAKEAETRLLSSFEDRLSGPYSEGVPTLFIDADGPLEKIPWAMLENLAGKALVERYSILQIKGLVPDRTHVSKPITRDNSAFVLADPAVEDSSFPPLPDALREGTQVAARFISSRVASGRNATSAVFFAEIPRAEVFHFAGHSVFNGGLGGLLLAGNRGFVTAEQISVLNLSKLRLAVLSSCSSGVAEDSQSAGTDLLMNSFLDAGAERVLASSWAVDSLATSQLMDRFYSEVLSGKTAADALREAVLYLRARSSTAHPSAWAAFKLYGAP